LDQDRPRWSFLRPDGGRERQAHSAHEPQRPQLQEFFARDRHAASSLFSLHKRAAQVRLARPLEKRPTILIIVWYYA